MDELRNKYPANIEAIKELILEEAANKWVFETNGLKWSNNDNTAGDNYVSFIEGAKWQSKKMYTEEELLKFGELVLDTFHSEGRTKSGKDRLSRIKFKNWFEEFKKKQR